MRNLGKRIDKLEASVNLTPRERREQAFKRMMEYGQTLGGKALNDLILFFREECWHKNKGNQEAQAELKDRLRLYCEGKEVKIIDEKRMPRESDASLDELPFTTTQNPNPPDFEELKKQVLDVESEDFR